MKRRPMSAALVCLLAAWCLVQVGLPYASRVMGLTEFTIGCLVTGGLLILLERRIGGTWRKAILWPVLFLLFLWRFASVEYIYLQWDTQMEQVQRAAQTGELRGTIKKVEEKNGRWTLSVREVTAEGVSCGGIVCQLNDGEAWVPETQVTLQGELTRLEAPRNPGGFDAKAYYRAEEIWYRMEEPQIVELRPAGWLSRSLWALRRAIGNIISDGNDTETAGVLRAMLLGEKGEVDTETRNLYQAGGISHILAISGLHVTFLGWLLYECLRRLRWRVAPAAVMTSLAILLYAYMTGGAVSTLRAAGMLILSLGAVVIGRTYDMISALCLSWVMVGVLTPGQMSQAGFQLSFGAVIAFAWPVPELQRIRRLLGWERKKKRRFHPVASTVNLLMGSLAVSLTTWPIVAWHMYVVSPFSVLINLIVLPVMSLLLLNIVVGVFVGAAGLLGICPPIMVWIVWRPAVWMLAVYRQLCLLVMRLGPGQVVTGRPRVYQLVWYGIGWFVVTLACHSIANWLEKRRDLEEAGGYLYTPRQRHLRKMAGAMVLPLLCLLAALGLAGLKRPHPTEGQLLFLDVGQGDGILYMQGDICLAMDGGSSFVENIGLKRITPALEYYGYQRVDAWFLTHGDADHVSGLREILKEPTSPLTVTAVYVPQAMENSGWQPVFDDIAHYTEVRTAEAGQGFSWEEGEWRILYPGAYDVADNENDLCFVSRLQVGERRVLFCGDISEKTEQELLARYAGTDELRAQVLKVAHHGSRFSSSSDFLEAVGTQLAVISVGKNNYGHPAEETLERLRAADCRVLTTLEQGAILLNMGRKEEKSETEP